MPAETQAYRFGDFEFDPIALKLRRDGQLLPLERLPAELLSLFVSEAGRLVSREEIARRLWGARIHVETELGINTAIRKLRRVLGDQSGAPSFIETIPRLGYRFIAPVSALSAPVPNRRLVIAVLPFEDLSPGVREDYLADGFTEETIARLGQIDPARLTVVGRTSIMALKRTTRGLAEIACEFGADYLVESSLRVERGRLRVVCQLIDAGDQRPVWAESYDGEPSRILAFQESISRTIATQISLQLSPSRAALAAHRQSADPAAFDLFLRGRYFWNQNTRATNEQAIALYRRATAIDPSYALAWSGLAETLGVSPVNGDVAPGLVIGQAREAARRAVDAGPHLAEPYAARGFVRFWLDRDWPGAESDFRHAIDLDPSYPFARRMLGVVLSHAGVHQEAREAIRLACELDPLFAMHHALASQIAFHARDFNAALEHARHATVIRPGFWIGHHMLAQARQQLGDHDGMFEAAEMALSLTGGNAKTLALKGYALARLGATDAARALLADSEAGAARYIPPVTPAMIHVGLGDNDAAFAALDRAVSVNDVNLAFLPQDAKWDGIRAMPRFARLMERCGFTGPFLHPAVTPISAGRHTDAA